MEFVISKKNVPWTLTGVNFPLSFSNNIKLSDYIIDNYFTDETTWKYNQNVKIIDEKNIEITIIDFPDGLENANYLKLEWSPITDKSYSFWVIDKVKIRYVKDKEKGLIKNIKLYCFLDIYVNYHEKMISSFKGVITTNRYHPKELTENQVLNVHDVGNVVCDDFCKSFNSKILNSDHEIFKGDNEESGSLFENEVNAKNYISGHLIFLSKNSDPIGTDFIKDNKKIYNLPYRILFIPDEIPVLNLIEKPGLNPSIKESVDNGDNYLSKILSLYTSANEKELTINFLNYDGENNDNKIVNIVLNLYQTWNKAESTTNIIPPSFWTNSAFGNDWRMYLSKWSWYYNWYVQSEAYVYYPNTGVFNVGFNLGLGYSVVLDKYVSIPKPNKWETTNIPTGLVNGKENAFWHFVKPDAWVGYFDSQFLLNVFYQSVERKRYPKRLYYFDIENNEYSFVFTKGFIAKIIKKIIDGEYITPHILSPAHTQMEFKTIKSGVCNYPIPDIFWNVNNVLNLKLNINKVNIISPIYCGDLWMFKSNQYLENKTQWLNKMFVANSTSTSTWPVNNDSGNEFLRSNINSLNTAKENAENKYNTNVSNAVITGILGVVGSSASAGYGLGMNNTIGDLTLINGVGNTLRTIGNTITSVREERMIRDNEIRRTNAIINDAKNKDANINITNSDNSYEWKVLNKEYVNDGYLHYFLYTNYKDEIDDIIQYRKINGVNYKKVFKIDNITDLLNHKNVESFEFTETEQIASRMFCPREVKDYFAEILKYIKFWNIDINDVNDLFSQDIENLQFIKKPPEDDKKKMFFGKSGKIFKNRKE